MLKIGFERKMDLSACIVPTVCLTKGGPQPRSTPAISIPSKPLTPGERIQSFRYRPLSGSPCPPLRVRAVEDATF